MGKASTATKDRVCSNCRMTVETDSKGLKKHFLACCKVSRKQHFKLGAK